MYSHNFFRCITLQNILCLIVVFTAWNRNKSWSEVRERNVAKLRYSAIC